LNTRLPAIDRLEGFHPGGRWIYRRMLVPVQVNSGVFPAWLYVADVKRQSRVNIASVRQLAILKSGSIKPRISLAFLLRTI